MATGYVGLGVSVFIIYKYLFCFLLAHSPPYQPCLIIYSRYCVGFAYFGIVMGNAPLCAYATQNPKPHFNI